MYSPDYPSKLRTVTLDGIMNPERSIFTVSIAHFALASTYIGNTPNQEPELPGPRIGDLVYLRATKTLYKVLQVRNTDLQFQFSQHTWIITLGQYIENIIRIQQHPSLLPDDPIFGILADSKPFSAKLMTEDEGGNRKIQTEEPENIITETINSDYDPDDECLSEEDKAGYSFTISTDGPGNEQLSTEDELGIITDDGRDKVQAISHQDIYDNHPVIKETRKKVNYKRRSEEKKPMNEPDNPFAGR
jgi:hypothetical protein